ncbi:MAG: hypothetical protein QOI35_453 [Cryptosporangiaceae bacterium]|nr:hypothetical protein [Cryptosporangiaceae bacterium]
MVVRNLRIALVTSAIGHDQGVFLAHAFGARYDLPIPLALFVAGGAAVVLVSFLFVLGRPAREPAAADPPPNVPDAHGWAAVGLAVTAALAVAGFTGSQEVPANILPTAFWLIAWIAVPLSCGIAGDWTRPVNPFAALARIAGTARIRRLVLGTERPLGWPDRIGWWPAAALFAALACAELVFSQTATLPRVIATGILLYSLVSAFAGILFGPVWIARGEVFSVLFATWGRLGWFRFGTAGRRGFTGGLTAGFDASPSRIAFVLLLLVSVNFDGLLATPQWARIEGQLAGQHPEALRLATFAALTVVTCAVFGAFALAAARAGRHGTGFTAALAGLLPSMLPIAFGYLLAHNLQYVLVNAQLLAPLLGNPVGDPGWPLHLPYPFDGRFEPDPSILPSAFFWYASVLVIVVAHVVAVVLAHRHLVTAAPAARAARSSEYPWLVAMVAYTMASLVLIAQPLATDDSGHAAEAVTGR